MRGLPFPSRAPAPGPILPPPPAQNMCAQLRRLTRKRNRGNRSISVSLWILIMPLKSRPTSPACPPPRSAQGLFPCGAGRLGDGEGRGGGGAGFALSSPPAPTSSLPPDRTPEASPLGKKTRRGCWGGPRLPAHPARLRCAWGGNCEFVGTKGC